MFSMAWRFQTGVVGAFWVLALLAALCGIASPPATLAQNPTPSYCQVTFRVTNQWASGFTAELTLRNTGPSATKGWVVSWDWAGDQRITQLWGVNWNQIGRRVVIRNGPHNGVIPSGGSMNIGFLASYTGSNATPSNLTCTFEY